MKSGRRVCPNYNTIGRPMQLTGHYDAQYTNTHMNTNTAQIHTQKQHKYTHKYGTNTHTNTAQIHT